MNSLSSSPEPGKMPGTWQALRECGQNGTLGGTWFSSSEQLNSGVWDPRCADPQVPSSCRRVLIYSRLQILVGFQHAFNIYTNTYYIYIYISDIYVWYLYLVFWSPVYFVIEKNQAYLWSPKVGDIYSLPLKFSFNLRSDYLDFGYSMKSKCELTINSVNWCAYIKDDLSFCLMCLGYQCCLRILQWLFLFGLTKLFMCWTAEFIVFWFWWWSEVAQSCPTLCPTPWTAAHQVPLSMEFSRQEYWNGLLFPSPGDIPDPGIKPGSPALYADALLFEPPGKSVKFDDEISW